MTIRTLILALLFSCCCAGCGAAVSGLPEPVVPAPFGVNIHFTGNRDREVKMIADAGFRFIRMDLLWHQVERQKGVYDFSGYDGLLRSLDRHGVRPLFILAYGNPVYSGNPEVRIAPADDASRQAFAAFARAAAKRYRNRGIIWEMWNEPNIGFWMPEPNSGQYMLLARAVAKAVREEDPSATFIGPALAWSGHPFLDEIVKLGALEVFDAVSVHPYRPGAMPPETAQPDWRNLRHMIDVLAPAGKHIPLVSGEWGYTVAQIPENQQADNTVRMMLANMSAGVRLSIWYDWHDDGIDPKEGEHNFGVVRHDWSPKPAYTAMQTMTRVLDGHRLVRRVKLASQDDWLLVFTRGGSYRIAAWTAGKGHSVELPVTAPDVTLVTRDGTQSAIGPLKHTLSLTLSGSPCYLWSNSHGQAFNLK